MTKVPPPTTSAASMIRLVGAEIAALAAEYQRFLKKHGKELKKKGRKGNGR